ncbi:hypothetical protein FV222_20405 [Methylobacterium sp. WL103]|uniref:hypothetical protein n=1 Tax=unclassified Methylobacterium TaxID=2615210 RepID=UPI0011C83A24|nr:MULTISPECIES: hypothetical protein [unclassified Methylobacterium]TXM64004.1 hypothetical protein FV226_27030 [Methylobacterium sp. WL12]TXM95640.1 hypothetical protein FV222_20405 [Methylobacterium sp. WL103]
MSMTHALYEFERVIPEAEVRERASRLLDHMVAAGEDPAGLDHTDFVPIAVKMRVRDWVYDALDHGFALDEPRWSISPEGDAHVILPFHDEAHAVVFRTLIL